ncbi:hypothetical protein Pen01_55150 [Phytomonospora endophytica]|nr:hypothetical protein Pen01_55150 [Phytomonospora endophytica]
MLPGDVGGAGRPNPVGDVNGPSMRGGTAGGLVVTEIPACSLRRLGERDHREKSLWTGAPVRRTDRVRSQPVSGSRMTKELSRAKTSLPSEPSRKMPPSRDRMTDPG